MFDGNSRFVFTRRVAGEFDGDGEAVFNWLYRISKHAIELAKRSSKKKV